MTDTPNVVLTWALDTAGGTGEEGEWNIYFPDGQTDNFAQVWADQECESDPSIVGFWLVDFGIQTRIDLKPEEARQLAAAFICAASLADDRAASWTEGADE